MQTRVEVCKGMGMNGFPWFQTSHWNLMGMGTIDEHFMGMGMGMGRRFLGVGIKVLGMENRFPWQS